MDDFTLRILPCRSMNPSVLNACRRHGRFHSQPSRSWCTTIGCSTPDGVMDRFHERKRLLRWLDKCAQRLSASWTISRVEAFRPLASQTVLNACRRHGRFHPGLRRGCRQGARCSTPVGVMDDFTPRPSQAALFATWCSTPVGVMDDFTSRKKPATQRRQVLNACRRHGSISPVARPRASRGISVLNACRRHGRFHRSNCKSLLETFLVHLLSSMATGQQHNRGFVRNRRPAKCRTKPRFFKHFRLNQAVPSSCQRACNLRVHIKGSSKDFTGPSDRTNVGS